MNNCYQYFKTDIRNFFSALSTTAVISLLLITACATKKSNDKIAFDVNAVKLIIEEKTIKFTKAHITGDTSFLNNIFTTDARVFAPGSFTVSGREAIAAINSEYIGYGIKSFKEETTLMYGSGEYLIQEGNYQMQYGKDNALEKGKFINIWKAVSGDWKLCANMWNTNP
jgi:ketosteroid isomerase-like protein